MAYELRISAHADTDILDAIDYYDKINPLLADRFSLELLDTFQKIKNNPQFYSYISKNPVDKFRDVKITSFPYVVIYEVHEAIVYISAVMHTSRKPFSE